MNAVSAIAAAAVNSQAQKFKGKRKSITSISPTNSSNVIDKMLSDRLNLADSKKFCDINNSVSNTVGGNKQDKGKERNIKFF